MPVARAGEINTKPAARAVRTASAVGAESDTTADMPAAMAFAAIS